ncbi:hypothetical protein B0H11DRAFT_2221569 [Mycena galericulata]|nr:hypothetical protein B0H11DRAFT_2221569 [Mycena galericulata]
MGKKKAGDASEPKKKTGKPSDIQGLRHQYLRAFVEKYTTIPKAKKAPFWKELFPGYWAAFPWCLALNEEPNVEDSTDYGRAPENDEEVALKEKVIVETEKKIKLWFARQRPADHGWTANPFKKWLVQLRTHAGPPPRKMAPWQYYMHHDSYHEKVNKEFDDLHGDTLPKDHLNLRGVVARDLLSKESSKVQKEMKKGAEQAHEEELVKHRRALDGLPSFDPAEQAEARTRFGSVVFPLLDALRAHTGYEITLFAGLVEFEDGKLPAVNCVSVHAGVNSESPPELNFSKTPNYEVSLRGFGGFVWDAHLYRSGQSSGGAAAAPVDGASTEGADEPLPPADPAPDAVVGAAVDSAPITAPAGPVPAAATATDPAPVAAVAASVLPGDPAAAAAGATAGDVDGEFPEELVPDAYASGFAGAVGGPKKAAKKRRTSGGGGRKAKRARKRKEESESEAEATPSESEEEEEEAGSKGEEIHTRTPPPPRAPRVPRTAATAKVQPKGWSMKAKSFLTNNDLGEAWLALVDKWWAREERNGFEGTTRSHATKKRPKQVGEWIQRARNYTPSIEDTNEYAKQWWAWWVDINPAWREEKRPMLRNREGPWECMDYNGQNGFLNVLMSLKWWRDSMPEASKDWEDAVEDVTWALSEMEKDSNEGARTPDVPATPTQARAGSEPNAPKEPVAVVPHPAHPSNAGENTTVIAQQQHSASVPPTASTVPEMEIVVHDVSAAVFAGGCAELGGLSEEELREIEMDPEAEMDEEE